MAHGTLSTADTSNLSTAGIIVDSDGQRVIPASVRADGSTRREIRVRPGYRPPEDVEVYKNRNAEAWKNRGNSGIPGAEPAEATPVAAGSSNKNAKRRAARKRAKERTCDPDVGKEAKEADESCEPSIAAVNETSETSPPVPTVDNTDKEKQVKALRKKIRQATELKIRGEKGENLLPEQQEKVTKIQELVSQLNSLGFDQ